MERTHMLWLHCNDKSCNMRIRVGRIIDRPVTNVGPLSYCPACGGSAYQSRDQEEDYWETLAEGYGMPIDLLRLLYNEWVTTEYRNFRDYVKFMVEQASAQQ